MLNTIGILLLLLWAFGFVTGSSLGGFIHMLLVLAILTVLYRVLQGEKVL